MRIAVVGSGIAGVSSAWLLSQDHTVDVYEANDYLGGHTCTVDVTVDDVTFPVDTGFQVFNQRTYPNLIRFFRELEIEWAETDMSFSVQVPAQGIEWAGHNIDTVFAQRKNVANPRFLRMLADIVRFSRDADRLLADPSVDDLTLGQLLEREGYGEGFTDWYLIPMGDAIWSTPPGEMLEYPAGTFLRFCNNHGLLHISGKPKWRSVVGGARNYVQKAGESFTGEVHTEEPVERIVRSADGVTVTTPRRTEAYDAVVIAAHPPQTLSMLADAGEDEREIMGAFSFWDNEVVLHTDATFMPDSHRAWAAWNFFSESGDIKKDMLVLTYLINRLQQIPVETPVMETLNRDRDPAAGTVIDTLVFEHPSFSHEAIRAQQRLSAIQGNGGVWHAGAWTRYGFHEDGILSGVRVAEGMGSKVPWGYQLDASRTGVLAEFAEPEEHVASDPEDDPPPLGVSGPATGDEG